MLNKDQFAKALHQLKDVSPKRKFAQSVDLVVNLKELDLKKPEEQVDLWIPLTHSRGKTVRIAALVGPELQEQAKAVCDTVIMHDDFKKYEGKKKDIKKLAKTHDLFIAQANIMPDVAKFFGRVLGPRGRMPNPKAGCVVPPNANLKALTDKLKKTLHVVAKTQLSAKCSVGKQDLADEQLLENIMTVYNSVLRSLPQEDNNIKSVLLKYSMGPPLRVGAADDAAAPKPGKKAARKPAPEGKKTAPEGKKPAAEAAPAAEPKAKPKKEAKPAPAEATQRGEAS